jgi:phosphoglycerol transferase
MANEKNKKTVLLLSLILILIFMMLVFRNAGLYSVVSSDESTYSKFSRLLPLSDSVVPSYLYLSIYRFTNLCGDQYMGCAKILNAFIFVLAAPFIYLTARRVCAKVPSTLILIFTLLGPINTYTSYFMPEALYFFSFWLIAWFILRLDSTSTLSQWAVAGALLGVGSLVKPHAFLMMPAFIIYIAYACKSKDSKWMLQAIYSICFFVVATLATKLLVGYWIVGKAGLSIFGDFYSSIATKQISNPQHYINLVQLAVKNINGHVLGIGLMYGLAVAILFVSTVRSLITNEQENSKQRVILFTFLVLVNLVAVVGLFTASVISSGPSETIERLHMRYYNFALPLLFIVAASQLTSEPIACKWRVLGAFPVGVIVLYAIYSHLTPYTPNFVDSPELRGFTGNLTAFNYLGGLSLFALILWMIVGRVGVKVFVYIFMPTAVIYSSWFVGLELKARIGGDVYDRAGIFAKQYLTNEELSKLVIIGPEYGFLFRALIHTDNPNVTLLGIPRGSSHNLNETPLGKDWILAIGENILPDNVFFQVPMNGFKLARVTETDTFDFKRTVWPGVLSSLQGLSQPEAWGTWSSGKSGVVTFEFSVPLPERFNVHLVAHTLGPNIGKDFFIQVGERKIKFMLSDLPEERVFEIINLKRLSTIRILIPSPVSPKELGLSDEDRVLGMAFSKMQIKSK